MKDSYLERPYLSIEILKKELELFPKESKNKQIDQNTRQNAM